MPRIDEIGKFLIVTILIHLEIMSTKVDDQPPPSSQIFQKKKDSCPITHHKTSVLEKILKDSALLDQVKLENDSLKD